MVWFISFVVLHCQHRRQRFNSSNEMKEKKRFKFSNSSFRFICVFVIIFIWIGSSITIMWNEFYSAIICYMCVFLYICLVYVCVISILLLFTFHLVRLDYFFSLLLLLLLVLLLLLLRTEAWNRMSNIHFLCDLNRDNYFLCEINSIGWQRTLLFYHLIYSIHFLLLPEIQLIPTGMGQFKVNVWKRFFSLAYKLKQITTMKSIFNPHRTKTTI